MAKPKLKKFRVTQSYCGSIVRYIKAKDADEAKNLMTETEQNITLEEMMDCNWDKAEVLDAQGNIQ